MGDYCRRQAEEAALTKWGDLPCFDELEMPRRHHRARDRRTSRRTSRSR